MAVDKIFFQYPEETIGVDNWHNIVIPNRGDVIKYKEKQFKVYYRIFSSQEKIVTVVLEEYNN